MHRQIWHAGAPTGPAGIGGNKRTRVRPQSLSWSLGAKRSFRVPLAGRHELDRTRPDPVPWHPTEGEHCFLCLGKLLARGFPAPELLIPMVGGAGSLARPAQSCRERRGLTSCLLCERGCEALARNPRARNPCRLPTFMKHRARLSSSTIYYSACHDAAKPGPRRPGARARVTRGALGVPVFMPVFPCSNRVVVFQGHARPADGPPCAVLPHHRLTIGVIDHPGKLPQDLEFSATALFVLSVAHQPCSGGQIW